MSFLDNLENNLKSLESQEEAMGAGDRQARRREAARREALASAPWAERLRSGAFTSGLLTHAARAGHRIRVKVQPTWLDTTLRLDARDRRLELRPGPEGVRAVFFENGREVRTAPVDLNGDPEALVREWLESMQPLSSQPPPPEE